MKSIFLSASIPIEQRDPEFFETANFSAIRESIIALTIQVTPFAQLVFGGHPAISPLVYLAAKSIGKENNVIIYQSKYFEDRIPKESLAFSNIRWTEAADDIQESLLEMRIQMLEVFDYAAAFAIGGMDGIFEEIQIFEFIHSSAKIIPVATTGAAANILIKQSEINTHLSDEEVGMLQKEYAYGWLFNKLLSGVIR